MEVSEAKRRIMDVCLDLFSVNGFEATSVREITGAVGIKKPSMYSHFMSKQEIFDLLLGEAAELYETSSLFARNNWLSLKKEEIEDLFRTPESAVQLVLEQVDFLLHTPEMSKVRRILTIEQFRNPEICVTMEKRTYTDLMNFHSVAFHHLIEKKIFADADADADLMALQFISPVSMQLYRIDRNPEVEEEAKALIEKHIHQFYKLYKNKEI